MKTSRKLVATLLLVLILVIAISTTVMAKQVYTPTEFKNKIDTDANGTTNVKSVGGKIVGLIRVIGTIASVGMLIVLGIKYMMGSAEERAEYKKTLFPYFIGAILIFAATNLADIIYTWASTI